CQNLRSGTNSRSDDLSLADHVGASDALRAVWRSDWSAGSSLAGGGSTIAGVPRPAAPPRSLEAQMDKPAGRDAKAVLVHGGFLGPWIWADTVTLLEGRGIRSVTVDLPSSQDTGDRLADLHDDAEVVRDTLNGCTDVVLCGHSYAGAVVSEAAAGPHRA